MPSVLPLCRKKLQGNFCQARLEEVVLLATLHGRGSQEALIRSTYGLCALSLKKKAGKATAPGLYAYLVFLPTLAWR